MPGALESLKRYVLGPAKDIQLPIAPGGTIDSRLLKDEKTPVYSIREGLRIAREVTHKRKPSLDGLKEKK